MPNRKRVRRRLAKYIDLAELTRRLKSQSGPLGRLHAEFHIASKLIEPGDNSGKVEMLVRNASADAKIVFQTCLKLLPNKAQNTRAFREAVAEDVIIPRLDVLEERLRYKIAWWTPLKDNGAERSLLLERAKELMRDVRDGAAWEDQDLESHEQDPSEYARLESRQPEETKRPRGLSNLKSSDYGTKEMAPSQPGQFDLGETIAVLYDELRHLKTFTQGRRKTESELRSKFPAFQLWKEMDDSDSFAPLHKQRFFEKRLDVHRRESLMKFIGMIIALEGERAYAIWKKYRVRAGLTRKRTSSSTRSSFRPS